MDTETHEDATYWNKAVRTWFPARLISELLREGLLASRSGRRRQRRRIFDGKMQTRGQPQLCFWIEAIVRAWC
jgi:hypothetical protein